MNGPRLSVYPRKFPGTFNWHGESLALYLVPLFLALFLTAEDEELCIIIICLLLSHLRVRACNPHLCEA